MAERICFIEGCRTRRFRREWCDKHFARWEKYGDPLVCRHPHDRPPLARIEDVKLGLPSRYVVLDATAVLERLWRSTEIDPHTECWVWIGSRFPGEYGSVRLIVHADRTSKVFYVHRLAWEATGHVAPAGQPLDHLCRNGPCWNPDHLELVTTRVNVQRGLAAAFRCGHNPTGTDIVPVKGRGRRCGICLRAYMERTREHRLALGRERWAAKREQARRVTADAS